MASTNPHSEPRTAERRLTVFWRKIDELSSDPRNPRKHDRTQIRRLARSIAAFGFNAPVLVDADAKVLAGHGRLLAARELGWDAVPTIVLDHLGEAEARAFVIADNRLAELSAWDDRLLAEQLRELTLPELDFAIEATGFALDEIELRLDSREERVAVAAPVRRKPACNSPAPVSRDGDTWRLGRHRIVCAGALGERAADMLMPDTPVIVVLADPAAADAIVRRWQEETGGTAHEAASGRPFDGPGGEGRDG